MLGEGSGDRPFRRGDLVWRCARPWSGSVQALLAHLQAHGFDTAPRPAGLDADWERVTFLPGKIADIERDAEMQSAPALLSAAGWLRRYHDCTAPIAGNWAKRTWQLPPREPLDVICHGDFAPYNIVLRDGKLAGVIDFETAHPGSRIWDLAYAIYRWAPLSSAIVAHELSRIERQIERARVFLEEYGLNSELRATAVDGIITRLEALVSFMETEASTGSAKYQRNIEEGHDRLYRQDIAYIQRHREQIVAGVSRLT